MNHKNEADILKEHGELTAENTRLKAELETAKTAAAAAAAKDAELAKLKGELETAKSTAAKVPTLEARVTELEAKDMDADKRAAAIVAKAGIRGGSTEAKEEKKEAKTLTQLCIEAKAAEKAQLK